jgi:DNA-binding transcriptional MocR family regulator
LKDPDLPQQKADLFSVCQARYRILKESLAAAGIPASPFNSGFFAMVPVAGDPEALRLRLLKQGIGIIALPKHGAIRIAYSSTSEDDIPAMVAAIAAQLKVSA